MINRSRVATSSAVAVVILCAGALSRLAAAGPLFWTVATQADFLKGTPTGVSIDAAGRLLQRGLRISASEVPCAPLAAAQPSAAAEPWLAWRWSVQCSRDSHGERREA